MAIWGLTQLNYYELNTGTLLLRGLPNNPDTPALTVNGSILANGVISNVDATNGLYYKVSHAHLPLKLDGIPYDAFIGGITAQGIETTLDLTNKSYMFYTSNYVRFTGWIKPPHTGGLKSYTFYLLADDCAQVFINNRMVLNTNYIIGEQSVTIDLNGNDYNALLIEWAQTTGSNRFRLQWENVDIVKETIPAQYLINNQLGFSIGGTTCVNGTLSIMHTEQSVSTTTGALTVAGGVGIGENLNVNNLTNFYGETTVEDTTDSTSIATGAFVCKGGMGISGDVYVGGDIYLSGDKILPNKMDTFTLTFTGPWSTNFNSSCYVVQLDSMVTISIRGINEQGIINTYINSTNAVPVDFRPQLTQSGPVTTFDKNGTLSDSSLGYYYLSPSGIITIYKLPSQSGWDTGSHCGFDDFCSTFAT